ncbi:MULTISPECIES: Ni/Fe-hydrogenase, b-type cytochrome subunit [Desulfosediminicola]|uniref:Ni/Fe-hydrogenase, b-type cytochrome subunit n=1 Tax=Desulfosediminicola TaxID=2886823 RepID=UPI0010AD9182|nr:Ni/Fe-hydrogenase, b-type cytochrome subunit [Desulfosediminicola ganghwensis]
MATYEKKQAWSILLRMFHWMYALSIVALCITGFYINTPWTNTMIEGSASWPMAWMRFTHFVAGYVFSSALIIRAFLYIFGNSQERVWDILPITPRNIKNLFGTILRYAYITDKHDVRLGHNVIAGLTYLFTFVVAILMVVSGFYMLFPEAPFWQGMGLAIFGSQQWGRYIHHIAMWWFMIFALIHVYLCIWNDVKEPEGIISSIFTGDKFVHK